MKRWLVPEVVQTSAMDCGPACLKSLVEGLGGTLAYGRLREACQTDVDGTSIDTLEDVGLRLGLTCEQVLVHPESVLDGELGRLPCLAVVRLPDGAPHFIVLWRRHAGLVQVMDPAFGRRWLSVRRVERELLVHEMDLDAATWRAWAGTSGFCDPLERRLRDLDVDAASERVAAARADPGWRALATLDAAARLVAELRSAAGTSRRRATAVIDGLIEAAASRPSPCEVIPARCWSARSAAAGGERGEAGELLLRVRGAVLLRASAYDAGRADGAALSRELLAALSEPAPRPGRALLGAVRSCGRLPLATLVVGVGAAALGLVLESALLLATLDVHQSLTLRSQRLAALGALLILCTLLLALELPLAALVQRIARRVESGLRVAFLQKLPRLEPRYFKTRPASDMAERAHGIHRLRELIPLAAATWRSLAEVLVLSLGLAWLAPESLPLVVALALACTLPPLLLQKPLAERDLRVRTHEGALGRFYLDALLGSVPVAAHGVERAMRVEHESLLVQWVGAGRSSLSAAVSFTALQGVLVHGLAAWLVIDQLSRHGEPGGALLLVLWVMTLIWLAEPLGLAARAYPTLRNLTLRLLEPLGAPEDPACEPAGDVGGAQRDEVAGGVALELSDVTVHAGGHELLSGLNLVIAPGSHVAIVGASGAGKSSLCGLLLGWQRPTQGVVRVDGTLLDASGLASLRRRTAWVDPEVQLWNRPLADNVRYGADDSAPGLAELCAAAELHTLLPHLPEGLQTSLGESGALVSGGEGQRVRIARALSRSRPRLVVLDEALRGLDGARRRKLLTMARQHWSEATLLHVTHRLEEALTFERVLVIDAGRVVEDGRPEQLAADESSRFARLLADERGCGGLWDEQRWRRVQLADGKLTEVSPCTR